MRERERERERERDEEGRKREMSGRRTGEPGAFTMAVTVNFPLDTACVVRSGSQPVRSKTLQIRGLQG